MLAIVIALVLLGSVVFTAPSSNATICFVVVVGILLLGGHLNKVALNEPTPIGTVLYAFYFLIPHLEWYDIRQLVVYNHPLVDWRYFGIATLYAAAYATLLLWVTWMVFRRKPLNL
jgi:hypothetical protein